MVDQFTGGAWIENELVTWGNKLRLGNRVLSDIGATSGCPFSGGIALQSGSDLFWWKAGNLERIDSGAAVIDMREMELFGRRGLMVIHRGMQLRFYERPAKPATRWPYSEIYSFYTASEQGGLLIHDVDNDSHPDIICGNYWVQSPRQFDLPWRLYAINLFHEHPLAASARLTWMNGKLLWLESKRPKARVVWFTPPPDPRELWSAEPLGIDLNYPRAVLAHKDKVWIGENNGSNSRLIEWPSLKILRTGTPLHTVLETPDGIVGIGPNEVVRL